MMTLVQKLLLRFPRKDTTLHLNKVRSLCVFYRFYSEITKNETMGKILRKIWAKTAFLLSLCFITRYEILHYICKSPKYWIAFEMYRIYEFYLEIGYTLCCDLFGSDVLNNHNTHSIIQCFKSLEEKPRPVILYLLHCMLMTGFSDSTLEYTMAHYHN